MNVKVIMAGLAVSALAITGCSSSDSAEDEATPAASMSASAEPSMTEEAIEEAGTIVDVAAGNPDFSTLVTAIQAAGLEETLSGDGPFTVFAPTNDAFAAVPPDVLDALLKKKNKDALTKVLTYHVVAGEVTSDMVEPGEVPTVEGQSVELTTDGGGVQVNGAEVIAADVDASNGVIHAIDEVLLPPDVDVNEL